jgi:hypothetical protein
MSAPFLRLGSDKENAGLVARAMLGFLVEKDIMFMQSLLLGKAHPSEWV